MQSNTFPFKNKNFIVQCFLNKTHHFSDNHKLVHRACFTQYKQQYNIPNAISGFKYQDFQRTVPHDFTHLKFLWWKLYQIYSPSTISGIIKSKLRPPHKVLIKVSQLFKQIIVCNNKAHCFICLSFENCKY